MQAGKEKYLYKLRFTLGLKLIRANADRKPWRITRIGDKSF